MKNKYAGNKLGFVIIFLLALVMLSSTLVGNLLAKYATATEGTDSARVAAFSITESGVFEIDVDNVMLKPGDVLEQPISVKNDSEVSVRYTLVASTTGNLPVIFEVDGNSGNPLTFTKDIEANDAGQNYILKIVWPEENNDAKYMRMVDVVKLSLTVAQND